MIFFIDRKIDAIFIKKIILLSSCSYAWVDGFLSVLSLHMTSYTEIETLKSIEVSHVEMRLWDWCPGH